METTSFEVLEIRASGAYATVCRARRKGDALKREVAVKALRATLVDNARALMRTRDEARMLARLSHPNIVKVEELLSLDRRPVLVMEWVEGTSLRELLDRNRDGLPVDGVIQVVMAASRALEAAWGTLGDQGKPLRIVHRDIKPGNLLVSGHGTVKVVDFGLSRGEYFERETTTVSTVLGSMGYMAPERFRTGVGDHPSIDIYALGLALVELISGRLPLLPRDPALHDRALVSVAQEVRAPELEAAQLQELRSLIAELCRFEPQDRPSHAELRERLEAVRVASGLPGDLKAFASRYVQPILDRRPRTEPRQHTKWEDVAFLEDPGDHELPTVARPANDQALADNRVRRFLEREDWAERKRELKWLLALHPQWTAAPFLEVLQRTTRPWWVFWVQSVTVDQAAVALEILRHRPVAEAAPYATQLSDHKDERVASAAMTLLSLTPRPTA